MSGTGIQENLKVSYPYITWVNGTNRGIMGHLYQLTSLAGVSGYFTDLDCDISWNNQTWLSNSLRFEGLKRKVAVGVNVDEQTIKIWATPTDTLWGGTFLQAAEAGSLDGATIVRYRIIWPFVTGNAHLDTQGQPIAVWTMFTGYTGSIEKGGSSHIELKVRSALLRLNVNMPRNYYQPGCLHTLFDSGCTLIMSNYKNQTTVASSNYTVVSPNGGVVNPNGADGISTYAQGRLYFASGVNEGLLTLIDSNDGTNLFLAYPLTTPAAVGDEIQYYPGCSNTCVAKFANQSHWRGFDKVPPTSVSI